MSHAEICRRPSDGVASLLLTMCAATTLVAEHFMHNTGVLDMAMKQKSIATTGTLSCPLLGASVGSSGRVH